MSAQHYIPRHILCQSDIRAIDDLNMKAATIVYQNKDLKLTPVVNELGADYTKSWRRLRSLIERVLFTGVGRPPFVDIDHRPKLEESINSSFKRGNQWIIEPYRSSLKTFIQPNIQDLVKNNKKKCYHNFL